MAALLLPPLFAHPEALTGKALIDRPSLETLAGVWYAWLGTPSTFAVLACCAMAAYGAREVWRAVQSSALSDGGWLRSCSARAVAAHVSIGVTEDHHRQSGVVRRHRKGVGHRQDNVRPVVHALHQSSSAAAELPVQSATTGMTERGVVLVVQAFMLARPAACCP